MGGTKVTFVNGVGCRNRTVSKGLYGPATARAKIDGREYLNFVGSGYLALSRLPEIREAVREALDDGVPFARQLPSGLGVVDPIFDQVEQVAARACGTEASVYFASGYLIGMIGLASLSDPFGLIAVDESAHYNLKDAATLSGLPIHVYAHCNVDDLREVLKREVGPGQRPVVLTDGAYATTGRIPPLVEYAKVLESYDGRLFIDESHSFGVVGAHGRGSAEYCGVGHVAASGATLSKAYCTQGAIVGCSREAAVRLRSVPPIRGACAGSSLSAIAAAASLV
jgi:8-amino-7-oxononanoate synthase